MNQRIIQFLRLDSKFKNSFMQALYINYGDVRTRQDLKHNQLTMDVGLYFFTSITHTIIYNDITTIFASF